MGVEDMEECKLLKWVNKEISEAENHIKWASQHNFDNMKITYEIELHLLKRMKQRILLDCK